MSWRRRRSLVVACAAVLAALAVGEVPHRAIMTNLLAPGVTARRCSRHLPSPGSMASATVVRHESTVRGSSGRPRSPPAAPRRPTSGCWTAIHRGHGAGQRARVRPCSGHRRRGRGNSDLDGDGEVDEPNTPGVNEAGLERGAIPAPMPPSPSCPLPRLTQRRSRSRATSPTRTSPSPSSTRGPASLEERPADPDDFLPGSPYGDALTLSGTDANGDKDPHDVTGRSGGGFNADDAATTTPRQPAR